MQTTPCSPYRLCADESHIASFPASEMDVIVPFIRDHINILQESVCPGEYFLNTWIRTES
jgi:hypothetical protein